MTTTYDKILTGRNLTGMIQAVKPGLPEVLPAGFLSITPRRIEGNTGTYKKVEGRRDTALAVHYGSKSKIAKKEGVADVPFVAWHSFMNMSHNGATLAKMTSGVSMEFDSGRSEIERQTRDFATLFENTRMALRHSALFTGYIYMGENGNLLPSSSGAVITIDFGVPAAHRSQLDIDGAGSIIGASWATAGTGILADLADIRIRMTKKTGYVPRHIFYGSNILGYLAGNTQIGAILQTNSRLAAALEGGGAPFEFAGYTWHDASTAFYEDSSGTVQSWVGADNIAIMPDPSPEWFEPVEGSYLIPGGTTMARDAAAGLAAMEKVYGRFSYANLDLDPPGITQYAGDTYLPLLKVPLAVAYADVTP